MRSKPKTAAQPNLVEKQGGYAEQEQRTPAPPEESAVQREVGERMHDRSVRTATARRSKPAGGERA